MIQGEIILSALAGDDLVAQMRADARRPVGVGRRTDIVAKALDVV